MGDGADDSAGDRLELTTAKIMSWVVRKRTNFGFELSILIDDHQNFDANSPAPHTGRLEWGFQYRVYCG